MRSEVVLTGVSGIGGFGISHLPGLGMSASRGRGVETSGVCVVRGEVLTSWRWEIS